MALVVVKTDGHDSVLVCISALVCVSVTSYVGSCLMLICSLPPVMIANPASRRKGIGKEAVQLMMQYGLYHLHVSKYIVKIGADNAVSLAMFRGLGFDTWEHVEVFDEMHAVLPSDAVRAFPAAPFVLRELEPADPAAAV